IANSKTDHHRRLRLLSFLNDVLPGREYEETLNIVTGGLLIGLEMLLKQKRRREKLLLVTYLPGTIFTPITIVKNPFIWFLYSDGKYLMPIVSIIVCCKMTIITARASEAQEHLITCKTQSKGPQKNTIS
ncbi:unnamed protein product, partial [Brassica rapa subsp. narinosa]